MSQFEDLQNAFMAADNAGDTESAQMFADEINRLSQISQASDTDIGLAAGISPEGAVDVGGQFNRQLGLTARYLAEPYQIAYDPIAKVMGIPPLKEQLPNIFAIQPETKTEKFVAAPSRALSAALLPTGAYQGYRAATGASQGLRTAPITVTPKTKAGEVLQAAKTGFKKGILEDPTLQAKAGIGFGVGAGALESAGYEGTPATIAGITTSILAKPTTEGVKNLYGGIKSAFTPRATAFEKADSAIKSSLTGTGVKFEEIPDNVIANIRQEVDMALKSDKSLSKEALNKLIKYRIAGITPTAGRITTDSTLSTKEGQLSVYRKDLQEAAQENNKKLINSFDDLGAGAAINPEDYGTQLANRLSDAIEQQYNQFRNRYARINQMREGRNLLFDHVYFTNKAADLLKKDYKQYAVPKEIQKLMNDIATNKMPLTLENQEQLRRFLGTAINSAKGNEKGALRTIRGVLDETPLTKDQRLISSDSAKQLRTELDSVRKDYKDFMKSIDSDPIRKDIFRGKEVTPTFFTNKVLNKTPEELQKFYKSLSFKEKNEFRNNYMNVIKDKIVTGDTININNFDKILNNPKKLQGIFNSEEIMMLKAMRDVAKYEKFASEAKRRAIIPQEAGSSRVVMALRRLAPLVQRDPFNVQRGLLEQTPTQLSPVAPTFSLLRPEDE
jgi:hypothetical protein